VRSQEVDLVIQDMNFRREATSGEEGIALFRELRSLHPDRAGDPAGPPGTHLETAVDLVKAGAADYIAKPWDDARLLTTVRNLLELRARRVEENVATRARAAPRRAPSSPNVTTCAGSSTKAMRCTPSRRWRRRLAHADVPVLITGPKRRGQGSAGRQSCTRIHRARRSLTSR